MTKSFKKLIPAIAMLLLSAVLMGTSTYAWFSMNTKVTATGMQVQAKAESGLLISADLTAESWANSDASTYASAISMVPTSTKTGAAGEWYHNSSTSADNATGSTYIGVYKTLSAAADSDSNIQVATTDLKDGDGVAEVTYKNGSVAGYTAADDTAYYLRNEFYLKSSGGNLVIGGDGTKDYEKLAIKDVTVTNTAGSPALDASLRIGIKVGSANMVILAPYAAAAGTGSGTGTITYALNGTANATTAYKGLITATAPAVTTYNANVDTGFVGTIPASTTNTPTVVSIYIWYEGEDVNCKSNNITASLDALTVSVSFVLTSTAADYTGEASAIS